uniref:C2H2-type domain-containing protein n=1 Tax=Sinocyclocheilus anshuiensis TaxID=1608454 RepID=A0A671M2L9_9TELE
MDAQKYSDNRETNSHGLSSTTDNEPKSLLLNEELNEPQIDTQMSVTTDEISSSQSERESDRNYSTVQTSEEAVCDTSCPNKSKSQCEECSDKKIHEDTADVNVSDTENQGPLPSDSLNAKNLTLDDAFVDYLPEKTQEANSENNNQIPSTEANAEASSVIRFRCHLCKKCFGTRDEYELHLQGHTNTQRYSCDRCKQTFSLLSDLHTHNKHCISMRLTKAKSSGYSSPRRLQPKSSLKRRTPQKMRRASPVKSPPKDFSFPRKLKKCSSLLACPLQVMATTVYDSQNNLYSVSQPIKSSYFVTQLNSTHQKSDPRKYFCPQCGRIFQHLGRLRAHMLTHSRGQSFTCIDCNRMFKNWTKFWIHQRLHRQKRGRFFCPKCGQGFRFVGLYNEHLQKHPELNAHACPFCPHTFSNAQKLRNHQQEWHRSTMPFICDICGKGFESAIILKRHGSAVHPYECGACSASFENLDLLFHHQLHHKPVDKESPCKAEVFQISQ